MKKSAPPYLSSTKVVLTFTFMQITSLSSLHAMDTTEDSYTKTLQIILNKNHFSPNEFVEKENTNGVSSPRTSNSEASEQHVLEMQKSNLEELFKSVTLSTLAASGIPIDENPTSGSWFSSWSLNSLYEKISNILPSLSWPNFFYPSTPSSPLASHTDPDTLTPSVLSTSNPASLDEIKPPPELPTPESIPCAIESPVPLEQEIEALSASVSAFLDGSLKKYDLGDGKTSNHEFLGLSLDGGGVRGLMFAMEIERLEREINQPVCKLFDIVGGTSIGGISALGLTASDNGKTPKMRGSDLAYLIENRSGEIFPKNSSYNPMAWLWDRIQAINYNRYPAAPLEKLIKEYVGECSLDQALTRVLVTAVNAQESAPRVFDSWNSTDKICKMWELGLCTSAAPTFFPEHKLTTDQICYLDGGLVMNNPGLSVLEGLYEMPNFSKEKTSILSLGTGNMLKEQIPVHAGLSSVGAIVSTIMATQSKSVEMTLEKLLQGKPNYFRANPKIEKFISLDQLDEDSLRLLKEGAESQYPIIEEFAASELVRRRLERISQ